MPKVVNIKKKKEEILIAAVNTFYEHGIKQSSMKHIANATGMGRSSIYSYFNNREEILNAILSKAIHTFDKILQSCLLNITMPVSEKIVRVFATLFYKDEQIAKLSSVVIEYLVSLRRESKEHDPCLQEFSVQVSNLFSALLQQGIEQGEFIHHDIQQMTHVLYALFESLILRGTFNCNIDTPIDQHAIQIVLNGITQTVPNKKVIS